MAAPGDLRCVLECWPPQPTTHRYLLHVALISDAAPTLTVIQKNPSLADGARRDPTVGKVEAWARRHRFGAVIYVNLFALRSPHPAALNAVALPVAIGAENDAAIVQACTRADVVVAAWGNPNGVEHDRYHARIDAVLALLAVQQHALHHVGALTRLGHPRHGLQWNGGTMAHLPHRSSSIMACGADELVHPHSLLHRVISGRKFDA